MVDFTLTDEQKALRELARDSAAKEIRPVAWDDDRDGAWPQEIIEKAHEDASSDVSGMRTRAKRQGDTCVLNGSKCFINGGYADRFTVYAKTDPEAFGCYVEDYGFEVNLIVLTCPGG